MDSPTIEKHNLQTNQEQGNYKTSLPNTKPEVFETEESKTKAPDEQKIIEMKEAGPCVIMTEREPQQQVQDSHTGMCRCNIV